MEESWNQRQARQQGSGKKASVSLSTCQASTAIDQLVAMRVILPKSGSSSFVLWLPNWGLVLSSITQSQTKVMQQIKRSHYKEMSRASFESQSFPGGLAGSFVVHTLLVQGKVSLTERPSGTFLALPKH